MVGVSTAPVLPLPGYCLTDFLGKGGFGEVWKCEAPGGVFKAVKIVHGHDGLDEDRTAVDQEWRAFQHVKSFRHPFLISIDRADIVDGSLIIVMELADRNLYDVFREHQMHGQSGVPREELLGYLREAAEALDWMNVQHGVQHLDIKPQNLFLLAGHAKVGDFGLVNRLQQGGGDACAVPAGMAPRYSAPEIFLGGFSSRSDQYSLAVLYQELLTGQPPFSGQNARQLSFRHLHEKPDLGPLPATDRPVLERALAKKPEDRFTNCSSFVAALSASQPSAAFKRSGGHPATDIASAESRGEDSGETVKNVPVASAETQSNCKVADSAAVDQHIGDTQPAKLRFVDCIHSGSLYETWRAETPDGKPRVIRMVRGYGHMCSLSEAQIAARLATIAHRGVIRWQVVEIDPGRVTLEADFYSRTLLDRFNECRNDSLPGIEREELLDYVTDAAEALDALHKEYSIRHDWLNPRNMFLDRDRLVLDGFGLAQLFWLPAGQKINLINGPYAAPELLAGKPHWNSDQYSLAVIYCEMLTGQHPFRKQGNRQATHDRRHPKLELLAGADREVIARALSVDPEHRFPSCTALIQALDVESCPEKSAANGLEVRLPPVITPPDSKELPVDAGNLTTPQQVIAEYITQSVAHTPVAAAPTRTVFQDRFITATPVGVIPMRVELFRHQWQATSLRKDDATVYLKVQADGNFWQRLTARLPEFEIAIHWRPAKDPAVGLTQVVISVKPAAGNERGLDALQQTAPALVESFRALLENVEDRRGEKRWPCSHPLGFYPIVNDLDVGARLPGQALDVSANGIRFQTAFAPPSRQAYIHLPLSASTAGVALLADIVRSHAKDQLFDVAARFQHRTP
jgi:serine/threonine protein kinase